MLAINEAMGFQKEPAMVFLHKGLMAATASRGRP